MGMSNAVMKLERKVYVVISSKFPPNFCVTTAAAAAQGPMIQVSKASMRIRALPVSLHPKITTMMSKTKTTWKTPTQKCHFTDIRRLKSTLQKVTNRMRNMKRGRIASMIGAKKVAAPSNGGMKANTL